jgi:hypothetical protein
MKKADVEWELRGLHKGGPHDDDGWGSGNSEAYIKVVPMKKADGGVGTQRLT